MSPLNRRRFFQYTAGALGAIGLSQLGLERRAIRYGQALAQDNRRKIALLVGIGKYAREPLSGPVNDVELQQQLLIHRFGFLPDDVHTLTDHDATRQGILDAFNQRILDQVGENDIVVFHFSGHGARVQEYQLMREFLDDLGTGCLDPSCQNTTIAPIDYEQAGATVQDIMGHTLLLMRSALPTDNVTFVLDCCFSGGGKRGNVVMRSRDESLLEGDLVLPSLTDEEWPYQEQLLNRLGWSPQDFVNQIESQEGKGFFVASSRAHQQSADYPFDGFTAGAFTYLLTQYLWHETSPLSVTIPLVASSTTRLSEHSQVPEYDPLTLPKVERDPIYHEPPNARSADALVKGIEDDGKLQIWLGGIAPSSFAAFNKGVIFTVIDKVSGSVLGEVRQVDGSRKGLNAKGIWTPANGTDGPEVAVGQLLREKLRGIPEHVTLRVGLDDTLAPDEKAQATENLSRFDIFEILDVGNGEDLHILIGRYDTDIDARMAQNEVPQQFIPPLESLGLFSATQEPRYESSFGEPDEPIVAAINNRLLARLKSLLIRRMFALMFNPYSQQLGVGLVIDHKGSFSGVTSRGDGEGATFIPVQSNRGIEEIPDGHQINVIVENNGPHDLYVGLIVVDAAGEVSLVFPFNNDDEGKDIVYRGESRVVTTLMGAHPYGLAELMLVASLQPLRITLSRLRSVTTTFEAKQRGEAEITEPSGEARADRVMADMLGSLDPQRGREDELTLPPGPRALGVEEVTVISQLFQVVPADDDDGDSGSGV